MIVSREVYPESWPDRTAPGKDCLSVTGLFSNSGQATSEDAPYPAPHLLTVFFGQANIETVNAVRLISSSDELTAIALTTETEVQRVTVEGECTSSGFELPQPEPTGFVNEGGVFGYSGGKRVLSVANNGSLILSSSGTGSGIVLLIPFFATEKQYYKYEKVEK